jgi:hypothetical protein
MPVDALSAGAQWKTEGSLDMVTGEFCEEICKGDGKAKVTNMWEMVKPWGPSDLGW